MFSIERKIGEKIKKSGLQSNFICQITGMDEIDLKLSINGKRKLKTDEFLALCVFLGLNFSDF